MWVSVYPCHHDRINTIVQGPCVPIVCIRLAYDKLHHTLPCVLRQSITHAIGIKITCHVAYGLRMQLDVTESRFEYLQHGMQHVLHWFSTLGKLVKTEDYRFTSFQSKPCVGVIPSDLALMVNHWHSYVTQIKVGYINHG